jgi:hypothetical protein
MFSQNHGHRHPLVGLATPEALRQHRALLTRYRRGMQKEDSGELFNYLCVFSCKNVLVTTHLDNIWP